MTQRTPPTGDRSLDIRIGDEVLGLNIASDDFTQESPRISGRDGSEPLPMYSARIADAWKVVDALRLYGYHLRLDERLNQDGAYWHAEFNHPNADLSVQADAPSASLAICAAALATARRGGGSFNR